MKFPNRNQSLQKVRRLIWSWLVQHPFVALSCGSWLIRINPRDQNQLVFYFLIQSGKPFHVFADRVLIVRGTRAHNDEKLVRISSENILDLTVPYRFFLFHFSCHRIFLFQIFRLRKSGLYFHCHNVCPFFSLSSPLFAIILLLHMQLDLCFVFSLFFKGFHLFRADSRKILQLLDTESS